MIGMITCFERKGELAKTLPQLDRVGLYPDVTLMSPCAAGGSVEDNRYKAYHLAKMAVEADDDGLLFLEDDIDVADTLPGFVRRARSHGLLTTFCVMRNSLYPEGFESKMRFAAAKSKRGVQGKIVELPLGPAQARRGFHGSQALWLPRPVLEAVLEARESFVDADGERCERGTIEHGFDFWVKDNAHRFGGIHDA